MKTIDFNPSAFGFYPPLIQDYLSQKENLKKYYKYFSDSDGFNQIINQRHYSLETRKVLVNQLEADYFQRATLNQSENIKRLSSENTFTVTTGHQLGIATGPLYTLYKILNTISLCKELELQHPDKNFVPVFWMAGEDHDIAEIQSVSVFGKTYTWDTKETGAAGRLLTKGIQNILQELKSLFVNDESIQQLIADWEISYQQETLAEASFHLFNQLFGELGLIVINPDLPAYKKLFIPYIKDDLISQKNYQPLLNLTNELEKEYHQAQLYIRPYNFFYLEHGKRERIEKTDSIYHTVSHSKEWTELSLITEIENAPENFSPNAALRPLFQEVLLPNLAYIGGPGELSYWLQLKDMFEANQIDFPILYLRKSFLLIRKNIFEQIIKLGLTVQDFLLPLNQIHELYINKHNQSDNSIATHSIDHSILTLEKQLVDYMTTIDPALKTPIDIFLKKTREQIDILYKKAEQSKIKKFEIELNKISKIKNQLYPNDIPQERVMNFLNFASVFSIELLYQGLINSSEQGIILIEE